MQGKYRQHLVKTLFGCYPFFCIPLPLVGVSVGSACLACWLLGFGENTYGDGWIMDRGKKCNCLVCVSCLIEFFCLCVWLMEQWMDGWVDGRKEGRIDGWMDVV